MLLPLPGHAGKQEVSTVFCGISRAGMPQKIQKTSPAIRNSSFARKVRFCAEKQALIGIFKFHASPKPSFLSGTSRLCPKVRPGLTLLLRSAENPDRFQLLCRRSRLLPSPKNAALSGQIPYPSTGKAAAFPEFTHIITKRVIHMGYLYETHAHTKTGFPCGKNTGDELVRYLKGLGYTGMILTDHILTSEWKSVQTKEEWEARVNRLCAGFEAARKEGERLDFDVFQGWEYGYDWNHFLVYGLEREWLLANPDCLSWDPVRYLHSVRAAGAFVVHAHPFREGVSSHLLIPDETDGVEVLSAMRSDEANRHAEDYAASYRKIRQGGTDLHWVNYDRLCGVETQRRPEDIRDYISILRAGEYRIFDMHPEHE